MRKRVKTPWLERRCPNWRWCQGQIAGVYAAPGGTGYGPDRACVWPTSNHAPALPLLRWAWAVNLLLLGLGGAYLYALVAAGHNRGRTILLILLAACCWVQDPRPAQEVIPAEQQHKRIQSALVELLLPAAAA